MRAGAAWLLIAAAQPTGKCFPYDPELREPAAAGELLGGGEPCADPKEARITIIDWAFEPECGCMEGSGARSCVIAPGTTVVWTFNGNDLHNIFSFGFAQSTLKVNGRHSVTFDNLGTYDYGCSEHPVEMSGYRIIVR
jgi:hypothetical protein